MLEHVVKLIHQMGQLTLIKEANVETGYILPVRVSCHGIETIRLRAAYFSARGRVASSFVQVKRSEILSEWLHLEFVASLHAAHYYADSIHHQLEQFIHNLQASVAVAK